MTCLRLARYAPRVRYERLAVRGLEALDLADHDHVVAGFDMADVAADKVRQDTAQDRYTSRPFPEVDAGELVFGGSRELARQHDGVQARTSLASTSYRRGGS